MWGVAAGVAIGATAAAVGGVYYSLPAGCYHQFINGVTYYQCGSAWYAPQYAGGDTVYVVVSPP
jgi:hypothetical protein